MPEIEDDLGRELGSLADAVGPPRVDVAGLATLGRRERTRRRGLAAGVAAAVVVVGLAVTTTVLPDHDDARPPAPVAPSPTPATPAPHHRHEIDLPMGGPTDLPWWSEGVLHTGTHSYPAPRPDTFHGISSSGGTTVVASRQRTGTSYLVTRDGGPLEALPLQEGDRAASVVISPDGHELAWVETVHSTEIPGGDGGGGSTDDDLLVAYDLDRGRAVGTLARTAVVTCCDAGGLPFLQGVLDDGRVVYGTLGHDRPQIWDPSDGSLVTIDARTDGASVMDVPSWPGGLMYVDPDPHAALKAPDPAAFVAVAHDGRTTAVGHVPQSDDGAWNPDGTYFAYDYYPDQVLVAPFPDQGGDGSRGVLGLPLPDPQSQWFIVGWETSTDLVVTNQSRDRPLVVARCDVVALTCEQVPGFPASGRGLTFTDDFRY